jgi:hypothetical protein
MPSEQRSCTSKQSFTEFVAAHPKMKFMFFGGKGGIGVALLDNEVRGTESLQGVARYLFPAKQEISSPMDALR